MAQKYDPTVKTWQSNIVRNYRQLFKEKYGYDCPLTDEQVWDTQEEYAMCEDHDTVILEMMEYAGKK